MENETAAQQSSKRSSKRTKISDTTFTADLNKSSNIIKIISKDKLIRKSKIIHNIEQSKGIKLII